MATIQELFGLRDVVVWKTAKARPLECAAPSLLYGLEIELENCPNYMDMLVPGMTHKEDGSLRNYGMEFILKPMTFSNVAHVLKTFYERNAIGHRNMSERCSVHVHTNCLNLSLQQLAPILLLYQAMEPLLFAWVGGERDKNIFCVPWSETLITANTLASVKESYRDWYKYTALNLRPLHQYGTIEFRHLPGQPDYTRILLWMNLIGSMYSFCDGKTLEELEQELLSLNSNSHYRIVLERVFGPLVGELLSVSNYEQALERGVLAAKYCVLNKYSKNPVALPKAKPPLRRAANPFGMRAENLIDEIIQARDGVLQAQQEWEWAERDPVPVIINQVGEERE